MLAEPLPQEVVAKLSGFPLAFVIVGFFALIGFIVWRFIG